uniref:Kinesin motor domain-containing protein n=1 Tax=Odontella aurita TaxID=265563 RepID=A0A7S4MHV7_9STRA
MTTSGLRTSSVRSPHDLVRVHEICSRQRASGASTTHDRSSRSHAILRLEVTNARTDGLECERRRIESELPAWKNASDNVSGKKYFVNVDTSVGTQGYGKILRSGKVPERDVMGGPCEGDVWIRSIDEENRITLRDVEDGNTPRTAEEWSAELGIEDLQLRYCAMLKGLSKDEIDAELQVLEGESLRLKGIIADREARLDELEKLSNQIARDGPRALGGSILLVDLAGADYDHRSGDVQRESAAINKSLLALKECLRSLSAPTGAESSKPVFRGSKLTRLLEDSLSPKTECTRRTNTESTCVMLINVSPDARLERGTVNALRYGQMYARGQKGATTASKGNGGRGRSAAKNGGKKNAPSSRRKTKSAASAIPPKPADPEVLRELREIYRDRVPEKTEEEVEGIIQKFAGREALLLAKVRGKYVVVAESN